MGKELVQITDYDIFIDYLIQQYKEKDNFVDILRLMNTQAEDIEIALFEIRNYFWLATAEGDQLDIIGELQNEYRLGRSDADYRTAIQARIVINNGSGEFETLITAMTALFSATTVQLQNQGDAILYMWSDIAMTETQFSLFITFLAAGVEIFAIVGDDLPFVFEDDPDGLGFACLEHIDAEFSDASLIEFSDASQVEFIDNSASTDDSEGGNLQGVWLSY